jgi:hypothetical protein
LCSTSEFFIRSGYVRAFNCQPVHYNDIRNISKKDILYTCPTHKQGRKTMTNKKTPSKSHPEKKNIKHQNTETEMGFKKLLTVSGCTEQTTDELLKWYTA